MKKIILLLFLILLLPIVTASPIIVLTQDGLTIEAVEDITANLMKDTVHIEWFYNDGSNTLEANLTLATLTQGSVLFVGADTLNEDNTNFFWDDTTNRLGLGTATPETLLHLKANGATVLTLTGGTSSLAQIQFGDAADTNAGRIEFDNSDNSLNFLTTDTLHLQINDAGTADFQANNIVTTGTGFFSNIRVGSMDDSVSTANSGINFGGASKFINFETDATERMRIISDGSVGIGTASPEELLNVFGTAPLILAEGNGVTSAGFKIKTNNVDRWTILAPSGSTDLRFQNNSGDDILTILQGGNVGIGTTTPDGLLNVFSGSAGAVTARAAGDELVIEHSTNAGMSILTPDTSTSTIIFGSPSDPLGADLKWNHDNNVFIIGSRKATAIVRLVSGGGVTALEIDGDQNFDFQAGDLTTTGRMAVGTGISSTQRFLVADEPGTYPSGVSFPIKLTSSAVGDPGGTTDLRALNYAFTMSGANAASALSALVGDIFWAGTSGTLTTAQISSGAVRHTGSAPITQSFGYRAILIMSGAGNTGSWTSLEARTPSITSTGVLTNSFGVRIRDQGVSGKTTNSYGIRIEAQSAATNNYAISSAGGNLHGFGTLTPTSPVHADQSSSSAAIPVQILDQGDIDDTFTNYIGTSAADGSRSISSDTTEDSAKFGAIQIEINGVQKWIRIYDTES